MQITERSVFVDLNDIKQVEEEERNIFIKTVLEDIGIPLEEIWPDISLGTVKNKFKLRSMLEKLEIDIIDDCDRGLKIYNKNDLLAEWFKPRAILRKEDVITKNPKNQYYYEIIFKTATQ